MPRRENRITAQTAPPEKVLKVPTQAGQQLGNFDQARMNHGPHLERNQKDSKK